MNKSMGPLSCPELPYPHNPEKQCEKEVVDNFTTFHVWKDNMVFDDMVSWTDVEEIILSN